jgi:hypothetical protein
MIDAALERQIRRLLDDCPLGVHNDRVLMPRHMPEAELAEWVMRVYKMQKRLRKRAEAR